MKEFLDIRDTFQQPISVTQMEKNELIFELSEAIQSDQPSAIADFKREKEAKIK